MTGFARRNARGVALPSLSAADRVAQWIQRRRGPQPGEIRLTQRNIYILPSRPGLLYGAVLFTMLVASINYQLSLGYALTFLLGGVGMVGILHTFRNLTGLRLRPGRADPVFAGQLAEFRVMFANAASHEKYAIRLTAPGVAAQAVVDVPVGGERMVNLAVPTVERGWLPIPRMKISGTFPLGIWQAWAYWQPDMKALVYPAPETPATPLPAAAISGGEGDGHGRGEDDLVAIRPYVAGDSLRRIAWKAIARMATDEILTKEFDGGARGELLLDWYQMPGHLDPELRIARLTRWVLDAETAGTRYALVLPSARFDPDHGPAHRAACLEALALMKK